MNTQLIKHLRQAAERVLDPSTEYNHSTFEHCNCGILAQCVTGFSVGSRQYLTHGEIWISLRDVFSMLNYGRGGVGWAELSDFYCSTTGLPFSEVIESLLDIGLTARDIANLENLSDEKIVSRVGLGPLTKDNPQHVAKYLEAWASLLEDEAKSPSNLRAIQAPVLHIVDVRDGKAISV
jgi:hypothetical protein